MSYDCIIVGGGVAGLSAAIYLARFRRNAIILDGGESRARWIPSTHNYPGFPGGVSGSTLLARMRMQAERFGAVFKDGQVLSLAAADDGFEARTDAGSHSAGTVLIATGVADALPAVQGFLPEAIIAGHVRLCPVCDAFDIIDRKIAIWGPLEKAVKEARFLRDYTSRITVVGSGGEVMAADDENWLRDAGVELVTAPVTGFGARPSGVRLELAGAEARLFDTLYLAIGAPPRTRLATALGAKVNAAGCLVVDAHQETSIAGLYAVGDVVDELNQISVATGHAAIAATAIHNGLPQNAR